MNHRGSRYVIGDPVFYDGEAESICIRSYTELISDMSVELGEPISDNSMSVISSGITRFVQAFFQEARKMETGAQVKEFADLCKERRSDLAAVCNMVAADSYSDFEFAILTRASGRDQKLDLAVYLPYIPKGLSEVVFLDLKAGVLFGDVTLRRKPRFFIYLYRVLFELIKYTSGLGDPIHEDSKHKAVIRSLLLLPVSLAQIYEKMNPDEDMMGEYGDSVYHLLTMDPKPVPDWFWDIFESVKEDILADGKPKAYVSDFRRAIQRNKAALTKPFESKDYYATLKAGTSTIEGRRFPTFVSSLFETDSLRSSVRVQEFDNLIGYKSAYRDVPVDGYEDEVIKTIMIPNPSKYKPRAIHIAQNAIQDRCKYIHRRLKPLLDSLATDCMSNQRNGVEFLRRVSSPAYRREHGNGIFASDFSNATDTLSQSFQNACLDIIFPPEISGFWGEISNLSKTFIRPDGTKVPYVQSTGQPQGLLGSFDCFSLGHHIIMLMLMKVTNQEDRRSSDFYRILGDDSIVSSVDGERVYEWHSKLCDAVSLIKNDSKSTKSFIDKDGVFKKVIIDFAKVSVYSGEFCSPLPSGLAMSYSRNYRLTKPSVVLWYSYHGLVFEKWMSYLLLDLYGDDNFELLCACSIIFSGEIPYLQNFEDKDTMSLIDRVFKGASMFSYGVSELRRTLFGFFVSSDKEKAMSSKFDSFDKAWSDLFPDEISQWSKDLSDDHKYIKLSYESIGLAEDLNVLYELDDVTMAEAIESLVGMATEITDLSPVIDRLEVVRGMDVEEADILPLFYGLRYIDLFSDNRSLGSLQRRSLREKMTTQSGLLQSAVHEFNNLFSLSETIMRRCNESTDQVVHRLLSKIQER